MAMIHVNRGATSLGTFSEEDVRDGLRTGRFLSTDLGWREGMPSWQPLSQFAEFAAATPAPPPLQPGATSTPQPPMPRSGLPWDQRQTKGLLNAFIETLQMVLSRPVAAFTAMKREGGLGEPLLYAIIGGTFGAVFAITYNFVLRSFTPFADRHDALPHLFAGLGWIFLLVLTPLFVVIGMFVASAILHVCLMIVGGAKQSRVNLAKSLPCVSGRGGSLANSWFAMAALRISPAHRLALRHVRYDAVWDSIFSRSLSGCIEMESTRVRIYVRRDGV